MIDSEYRYNPDHDLCIKCGNAHINSDSSGSVGRILILECNRVINGWVKRWTQKEEFLD